MSDLKSPRVIVLKGFLMLFAGASAGALLLWENPGWRNALLLGVALWGFMRFYYFAFYVIEKYVDGKYRFAGLGSFLPYAASRRWNRRERSGSP